MPLEDYPVESITFTGLGSEGPDAGATAQALAQALNEWAAANRGRRLLSLTTVPTPARERVGLAALLAHTAGSDLSPELAEQVAAAIEDADRPQSSAAPPAPSVAVPDAG